MKNILLPLLSIFFSCSDQGVKIEKKTSSQQTYVDEILKKVNDTIRSKDNNDSDKFKEYLKISLPKNNIYIGKMYSINESINDDFLIYKKKDTIFVKQLFLESDAFDGKELIFDKKMPDCQISVKYYLAYSFKGLENTDRYIDMDCIYNLDLSEKKIPSFTDIKKRLNMCKNSKQIIRNLYHYYIAYYSAIPEAVLKKDSPSDFEQYNTFKKKTIETIDIEELGFYLSYNKMIINLTIKDKNSVIVFKKVAYKE